MMLYTIAAFLVLVWYLGILTTYTLGGVIHILLVIAFMVIMVRIISGQRLL